MVLSPTHECSPTRSSPKCSSPTRSFRRHCVIASFNRLGQTRLNLLVHQVVWRGLMPSITTSFHHKISLCFTFSENASLKRLLIRKGQDKFLYGTIVICFSLEGVHFKSQTSNRITYCGCRPPPDYQWMFSNSGVGYHLKEINRWLNTLWNDVIR